tara:strand:+ start:1034 stop:1303 length:270 start_codon:yes stop_codon:yes gene_type:complete
MKSILTGILSVFVFFGSVSIAQGTETDIEAMNDMNRHHFDNQDYDMKDAYLNEDMLAADIKKKKKKGKKLAQKGKKKKKGFFSKIFGSK